MAFPLCAAARVDGPGPPPIVLDEHFKVKPIFPVMEVIEDRSGNLTLDEVTTGAMSSRFVKLPGNPPNPGFSTSVFWLRFAVKNEAGRQLEWMLQIAQTWTKRVELFIPEGTGFRSELTGKEFSFNQRLFSYHDYIFPITQGPGVALYYIRIDPGFDSLSLALYSWEPAALKRFIAKDEALHWIIIGLLTAMFIYGLLLWFSVRDRTYLFFAAFAGALGFYMLDYFGLAFQHLWPESIWWKAVSLQVLASMTYLTGIILFNHYLRLPEFLPRISKALMVLAGLHVTRIIFRLTGLPMLDIIWFIYINSIVLLLLIFSAIYTTKKGLRQARFFLAGAGVLIIAALTLNLRAFAIISDNFITLWGVQFAMAMLVILVALGLADSLNAIKNELMLSQNDLLLLNRQLDEERERLSVTLRSIGDGVITTDLEGRIVLMNRAAEKMTGMPQSEARGMPVGRVLSLSGPDRAPVDLLAKFGDGSGQTCESACMGMAPSVDGGERIIEYGTSPVSDRQSRVVGMVLAFRDITERRMLEEEMLRSSRIESLGVLAGGIAHDFNNVLTIILGNITLAKMITPERERVYRILSEAEAASYRARKLTRQLLTFSRGGEPIRSTVDPGKLLVETVNFVLTGSHVRAEFDFWEDLALIEADEGQIIQVINNVTINAMQAMPDGGVIRVRAENREVKAGDGLPLESGPYLMISISDKGGGIPEEYQKKIFDPYFTTKSNGTGLGLASSYSIVRKHGGNISASSSPGDGTEMIIYLPALAGEQARPEPYSQRIVRGGGKILIMDDDENILDIAGRLLHELGYDADYALNGEVAVEMYRKAMESGDAFDAVIMDLTIQGGSGGRLTIKRLLEIDPGVRAIVSSGYSNDPIMANYREYGFRGVVVKPYRVEELSMALHEVLSDGGKYETEAS